MFATSPERRCRDSLAREPVPLYSDSLRVALLWNAKAGCTFAIKWLYFQEGVLEEALAYSPWPHRYRRLVYYKRPGHSKQVRTIPELGPRALKFVRNPFDRAVGSYLSYCNQARGTAKRQHKGMLKAIGKHLGRSVGDGRLFTFREFVGFLATLDLESADIHVRVQAHLCERQGMLPQMTVMRVEESAQVLPQIEDELGLRRSDIASLSQSRHHTLRAPDEAFAGDTSFGGVIGTPVPASRSFYDGQLTEAVADLYAVDIERYGYTPPE